MTMYYQALYKPQDSKGLSDKAKLFIGKRLAIQDGGKEELIPGKLQVVYIASPNIGLIPNTDLENITSIPHNKWTELADANADLV